MPSGSGDEICALPQGPRGKDLVVFAVIGGVPEGLATAAYLPTPLGPSGVKVILPFFKFLGINPANWTTNPFAN